VLKGIKAMTDATNSECPRTPPLKLPRPPAVAKEEFLTTIAQGMWAEEVLRKAVNNVPELRAIKYGPSRYDGELISNRGKWKEYITRLYRRMSIYGKRPDLLVFKRHSIPEDVPDDISEEDEEAVKSIVSKAIAAFECRSSAYYYEQYVQARPGKTLSITVKNEDIERLNKWRSTYCGKIPIYYVQVFFDVAWALPYDHVLKIIELARMGIKPKGYERRVDKKTGKETHFIPVTEGILCARAVEEPVMTSEAIRAWDGKVIVVRMPKGGRYQLTDEFVRILLSHAQPSQAS